MKKNYSITVKENTEKGLFEASCTELPYLRGIGLNKDSATKDLLNLINSIETLQ